MTIYYLSDEIKSLTELSLPPELNKFFDLSSGLLIISGPYSSGKSTTAASFIEEFNRNKNKRIVTLEDPIERLFVSKKSIIEQRQIGVDVKNITEGLYYCLKEDIDLVYLSENMEIMDKCLPLILELASGNALVMLEINAQSSISA